MILLWHEEKRSRSNDPISINILWTLKTTVAQIGRIREVNNTDFNGILLFEKCSSPIGKFSLWSDPLKSVDLIKKVIKTTIRAQQSKHNFDIASFLHHQGLFQLWILETSNKTRISLPDRLFRLNLKIKLLLLLTLHCWRRNDDIWSSWK